MLLISNTSSYLTSEATTASEVAMASEATKRSNMHIDARVTEVANFKYMFISDFKGHHSLRGCHGLQGHQKMQYAY